MKFLQIIILVIFVSTTATKAQSNSPQTNEPEEVFVKSWKTGKETIVNQNLEILLSSQKREYQAEIIGKSGKNYQLNIKYDSSSKPAGIWKVRLREITAKTKKNKKTLGSDLLTPIKYEEIYDYLPEGINISYLYPGEPKAPVDSEGYLVSGALPMCDHLPCYPIKTIRKIKIESFCIIIKVKDYKINVKDKTKLDSMEIFITFTNECT